MHAPSTALRAVPLPRCVSLRSTSRGRIVLLRHNSWRHFRVKLRAQQAKEERQRADQLKESYKTRTDLIEMNTEAGPDLKKR